MTNREEEDWKVHVEERRGCLHFVESADIWVRSRKMDVKIIIEQECGGKEFGMLTKMQSRWW